MELRQLVYFDAGGPPRRIHPGRRELRVAQPAVSAQIRRLEAELACPG